ncbi:MAG: ABC transporter ATP-binding protein [Candidatus Hodarchaeales archaeon]
MLSIDNLSVRYQNSLEWNLQNISLKANAGQLIIVAGSSGSGKSTLANTIIGIIPGFISAEVSGKINLEGKPINSLDRKEKIMYFGYVPQYPSDFITTMLVEEEIAFPLENFGFDPAEAHERIDDVLKELGISHLKHKLMTELSSGELQKVSIATAIAPDPPILIFDEPMARIDPSSEIALTNILRKLCDNGKLIIAFEHRLDYLLPKADMVYFIDKGRIKSAGTPQKIIESLHGIDLPEVSKITIKGKQKNFLTLEDVVSFFTEKYGGLDKC